MSTFSGLNAAYTGLVAARQGLNVVGQNIINANTEGYTRQRISTSAAAPLNNGIFTTGARPGQGVFTDGVQRLGDIHLDNRVRTTAAAAGYSTVRANTLATMEASFREPGENGLSARFQDFWAAWQDAANEPAEPAVQKVLLAEANALASGISQGRGAVEGQWSSLRSQAESMVTELNGAASAVADLNNKIRSQLAAGGSANELIDQRSLLTTTIAALTGSRTRNNDDGTIDVTIGGNAIVTSGTHRPISLAGATSLDASAADVVRLEWQHRPGDAATLDGGELAGALSMLAPAGSGGELADAAANYDRLATELATQVNTLHRTGSTADGTTGLDFFSFAPGNPASSLKVVPVDGSGIASSLASAGGVNGNLADAISQIGGRPGSPDDVWAGFVTSTAVRTKTEIQQATIADISANAAANAQLSNATVDLDEENVQLLAYQHAYQGAARVMTAIDAMLDTLINRTGIVGR